jgi:phosphatidylinositol alpha-mannosyltransferase
MTLQIALTHVYAWPEVRRGGERYLHELASALADSGHDVRVLTTAPTARRGTVLGVEVTYLRRRRIAARRFEQYADEVAFGVQAMTHLASNRLDVWHAFGTSDAAAAALLGRVRSVRSVYTDLGIPGRESRGRRPDRRFHRFVVDHADHYLCLSASAGQVLADDFGRTPGIVGGGVDLRRFAPADRRHATPVLLFTGSLDTPRKNLGLLLEAVEVLHDRGVPVALWLSGPGDPRATLEAAPASARAAVELHGLGEPERLGDLYGRAWATVLPSVHEAFGLVLVESLACGTPVVALDEGGPGEIVQPGIGYRAPATAEGLADACAQALDLAAQPGTATACRAYSERYDWRTAIVPALEAVYH